MTEELEYPQITPAQLEIWMDSPVTKTYLQCLEWSADQIKEILGNGGMIDSSNSDLTHARLHSALGEKTGLLRATDPDIVMRTHKMIGVDHDKDI